MVCMKEEMREEGGAINACVFVQLGVGKGDTGDDEM